MASVHHSRKPSSRTALPRRTTKGPLDAPTGPLPTVSATSVASAQNHSVPLSPSAEVSEPVGASGTATEPLPASSVQQPGSPTEDLAPAEERDLSFLLDASIYHALSQLEVPGPFRKPFLPPPNAETPLKTCMQQLDSLLSQCDFLRAAQLAGSILVSGTVRPMDSKSIFRLLEIRYSCLELSGNLLLAAQEAKALEDLSSGFYYDEPNSERGSADDDLAGGQKVPTHIMPFSLRLQALRLQSIGFSDPRRGVSTLYDVALECREHLSATRTSSEQRELWTERLGEVSVRVVNALIEMGDVDCAARTLAGMRPATDDHLALWTSRMSLLRIKMGDIAGAKRLIESGNLDSQDKLVLGSLLHIAEGRYDDAMKGLSENGASADSDLAALVKQNLAVAYLYRGEIQKSRQILEKLVNDGHSFQTLTINLATIYDLTSDRSRELKASMVSHIAGRQRDPAHVRTFVNADFKL
ncbi:uncharacterized protein Z520_04872 [Fonsecaea multimorphosa CBS 102226]|uniref:Uncharacterized protein n=1 Tax=Fonsecaea multimorphosa CBS 102226 TaxID=1442371 RepID=A0A0D2IQN9_9EURO|nr:uncharacterized protein Z520_04872 [Fonsecaea multimorphosa CBS 102226]KIX99296.1 hypothetical protein Z520_04872 [Fonsecaea multimorphosa CBS 102226]OAL25988.1 hypothetical protein AYO22_04615 [Fonsecaea multimorphosa]